MVMVPNFPRSVQRPYRLWRLLLPLRSWVKAVVRKLLGCVNYRWEISHLSMPVWSPSHQHKVVIGMATGADAWLPSRTGVANTCQSLEWSWRLSRPAFLTLRNWVVYASSHISHTQPTHGPVKHRLRDQLLRAYRPHWCLAWKQSLNRPAAVMIRQFDCRPDPDMMKLGLRDARNNEGNKLPTIACGKPTHYMQRMWGVQEARLTAVSALIKQFYSCSESIVD